MSENAHDARGDSTPPPPDKAVWLTTSLMVVTAAAMQLLWLPREATGETPFTIPWWALAIAFATVEIFVIHIPVQRDTHTVSLSEVAFILGLALLPPLELIMARLVGSSVALTMHRRQPIIKLAFNVSLFYLEVVIDAREQVPHVCGGIG